MSQTATIPFKNMKIIVIAAIVWNLMGVYFYIAEATMSGEALAALPVEQRPYYEAYPAWATAAFAFAVFGGLIGSVLLLLRKAWALPVLIVSLVGVLVSNFYNFALGGAFEIFGIFPVIMQTLVTVIAVFLVWYAHKAKAAGVLS